MTENITAWLASAAFGALAYCWLVRKYPENFSAPNFRSNTIPSSAGVYFILAAEAAYVWMSTMGPRSTHPIVASALVIVLAFGILGLLDDLYGDRSVGGLKGHFDKLLSSGKITTGLSKAVGGSASAVIAGFILQRHNVGLALLNAVTIALSANAANLFDTRPGRSLTFCLVFGGLGIFWGHSVQPSGTAWIFEPPMVIAITLFVFDRSAKVMIGDAGANAIGALTGLIWVVSTPFYGQMLYLAFLIWFHWWTESHSLSRTIERIPWMRNLDRVIGVRG